MRIINEAGGDMNGTTNKDRTNYYENRAGQPAGEGALAGGGSHGLPARCGVSQKKFEIQRATVKNERPSASTTSLMAWWASGWGRHSSAHPPLPWQAIGYVEDPTGSTSTTSKQFFLRWYGPQQCDPDPGRRL